MTYADTETGTFSVGDAVLTVARNAGPRIVSYASNGVRQLFAHLPRESIDHFGVDPYYFIGGHRLWRAPEIPAVTYQRDDLPVTIREIETGIEITGTPDSDGVVKVMDVTAFGDMTVVDHVLRNEGERPVTAAPWAITQVSVGGVGVVPQARTAVDDDGVLPNRSVVMWPYTDPSDSDIVFGTRDIRIAATTNQSKAKIGTQNTKGWIAYHLSGALFVKWAALHDDSLTYPDRGSSIECYRDDRFMELETLGPMVTLEPGDAVSHREVWKMIDVTSVPVDEVLESLPTEPEAMHS
jgi:hypothetical protein